MANNGRDFLELLGPDVSFGVFRYLDDPADLVRTAAVSRAWRQFVIANDFSKRLCTKLCPEVSYFTSIKEVGLPDMMQQDESSSMSELRIHERDHKIYTYISQNFLSTKGTESCISHSIGASSTDNFPEESIENTLEPSEEANSMPSYWSSGGEVSPDVPESLTYRLIYDLVLIDEIRIRPYRASFQLGDPIYSSKFVQFKLGFSKLPITPAIFELQHSHLIADENYVWTYTSPQFPMQQENVLQSFKLPRPVLCIGGVVKVELIGRVQKQDMDDLFYICICHVQVSGRKLSPLLGVDLSGIASGGNGAVLKYYPLAWMNRSLAKGVRSTRDARRQPLQWRALFNGFRRSRRS